MGDPINPNRTGTTLQQDNDTDRDLPYRHPDLERKIDLEALEAHPILGSYFTDDLFREELDPTSTNADPDLDLIGRTTFWNQDRLSRFARDLDRSGIMIHQHEFPEMQDWLFEEGMSLVNPGNTNDRYYVKREGGTPENNEEGVSFFDVWVGYRPQFDFF